MYFPTMQQIAHSANILLPQTKKDLWKNFQRSHTCARRFELPTPWSVAKCSIQLSYAHIFFWLIQISLPLYYSTLVKYPFSGNAGDRNRTGTVSLQQDFKSCASASSATPAFTALLSAKPMEVTGLEPVTLCL